MEFFGFTFFDSLEGRDLLLAAAAVFIVGLILTIKGGDWFVDSASWFAEATGIPKFVVGATIVSFVILIAFTLCGQFLFKFFGISTNGFRIAAGFIILKIGYDMLQARYSSAKLNQEEIKAYVNDISITPLSIPMLCGPGAIANGIILMSDATTWELKITLIAMIAVVYVLSYIVLRLSTRLVKLIGETGNNVMMRLMGLILMVIAVECFVGGLKPILIDIIQMSR